MSLMYSSHSSRKRVRGASTGAAVANTCTSRELKVSSILPPVFYKHIVVILPKRPRGVTAGRETSGSLAAAIDVLPVTSQIEL